MSTIDPNVRTVYIFNRPVTGNLTHCTSLKAVFFSNCDFTEFMLESLPSNIEVLNVMNNRHRIHINGGFGCFTNLKDVSFFNVNLLNFDLTSLPKTVTALYLSKNPALTVTGKFRDTKLQTLSLFDSNNVIITPEDMPDTLQTLKISPNNIKDGIQDAFKSEIRCLFF